MNLNTKDVEKIGFKGTGLFDDSKWHHYYYAKLPKTRQIYIIDDLEQSLSHFDLNKEEWKAFENNKLSLIPRCCVYTRGNRCKENPVLDFYGNWKKRFGTKNNTLKFIEKAMKG